MGLRKNLAFWRAERNGRTAKTEWGMVHGKLRESGFDIEPS